MPLFPNRIPEWRKNIFVILLSLIFVVLLYNFYRIQITQHSKYSGIAENNRVRMISLRAPRGIIYDREGKILADNEFQYNISVIPYEMDSSDKHYQKLGRILGISRETIQKRVKKNWRGEFRPALIAKGVDFKTLSWVMEHKLELPGVIYTLDPYRNYPTEVNLTHVLGYLREITGSSLEKYKKYGYDSGDLIGSKGVEKEYESILRGEKGYKYVQVNAKGRVLGDLERKDNIAPKPGNNLYLTIEKNLQEKCEHVLQGKKGAMIVMNPENGEILAGVSKPDYSPELFSGVIGSHIWDSLKNNPKRPLYNRITKAQYPPGSTFKMMAAMGALDGNIVDSTWTINCPGYYVLGRRKFKDWKKGGHGKVDMVKSIEQSCDVYYYTLIRKMELDYWAKCVRRFGFGRSTGIDLPEENIGNVPDISYMNQKYGKNGWTEGYKLNIVIGQGEVLVTPVQMARYISAFANGGKLIQPHIGLKYYDKKRDEFKKLNSQKDEIEYYSPETWQLMKHAMYRVVNVPLGTANLANTVEKAKIYGKTGTSQNAHGKDHAWFVGYMEYKGQKISIVVFLENGGGGGKNAAPLAGKIFEYYNKMKWKQNNNND